MSDMDEPDLDELERRLDAAFAATRPRRGFQDELWARLTRRRAWWSRLGWPRSVARPAPAAGLALVLVAGLVLVVVAPLLAGGRHGVGGGSAGSSAMAPSSESGGSAGLPFGLLPPPPAAPAVSRSALGVVPQAGASQADVRARLPVVSDRLTVYRYRAAAGPPAGSIFDQPSPPPGAESALYPARPPAEAIGERDAVAAPTGSFTVTGVRLAYLAVVDGQTGYLEPVYLLTGTTMSNGTIVTVTGVLPAIARTGLR